MVELIVVIVIVGILSTLAAAQLVDRGTIDAPAFAQQTRAMLRFGQKLAVAQNRPVFVSIAANRVALCFDGTAACGARVQAPGGSNTGREATLAACGDAAWYCEGVPDGVVLVSSAALIYFDGQGRPFAGIDPTGTDTSTFATLTIALNGSAASENVIVEPETGYVH